MSDPPNASVTQSDASVQLESDLRRTDTSDPNVSVIDVTVGHQSNSSPTRVGLMSDIIGLALQQGSDINPINSSPTRVGLMFDLVLDSL